MFHDLALYASAIAIAFGTAHSIEAISRPEALSLLGRKVKRQLGTGVRPDVFQGFFEVVYGGRPWSPNGVLRATLVSLVVCIASYIVFFLYNPEYFRIAFSSFHQPFWRFNTKYFFFVNLPTDLAAVLLASMCFRLLNKKPIIGGVFSFLSVIVIFFIYGFVIDLFQSRVGAFDQIILTEYDCEVFPEYRHYFTSSICGVFKAVGLQLEDEFAQIELAVTAFGFEPQTYNAVAGAYSAWLGSLTPYLYSTLFALVWPISAFAGICLSKAYQIFGPLERLTLWLVNCDKHPLKAIVIVAVIYLSPFVLTISLLTK